MSIYHLGEQTKRIKSAEKRQKTEQDKENRKGIEITDAVDVATAAVATTTRWMCLCVFAPKPLLCVTSFFPFLVSKRTIHWQKMPNKFRYSFDFVADCRFKNEKKLTEFTREENEKKRHNKMKCTQKDEKYKFYLTTSLLFSLFAVPIHHFPH